MSILVSRSLSEVSESQKQTATEPSFLWANEGRRKEVQQSEPQPPAAKRHKPNFNSSVFGASTFSFTVSSQ